MKAVVPVAGAGTRLRPLTYSVPKALLMVAGRPIVAHILDLLTQWEPSEIILVVSPGKAEWYEALRQDSEIPVRVAVQENPLGLGHAILQARHLVDGEPMVVVYGDTIVETDPKEALSCRADVALGVMLHDDPRRFGIVELDGDRVIRLREKPAECKPGLVIVGINYVANSELLFDCLQELMDTDCRTKGEFQATDAFQLMVERGATIRTFPVSGWYDCGTPESLLSTQRILLEGTETCPPPQGSAYLPPVSIDPSAHVEASVVGPYVTVADGATVRRSILSDCVIHQDAVIEGVALSNSIVGHRAQVKDQPASVVVGACSRWTRAPSEDSAC
jgi:glucose-1-phosphate thymidylyltransferase